MCSRTVIFVMVSAVISFLCFTNIEHVLAGTLVVGDINALVSLSHSKYLDSYPVLFFTDQLEPKTISRLLDKISIVLLANRQTLDLVLDLIEPRYRFKISNENQPISFVAEADNAYEVWGRNSSWSSAPRYQVVRMTVDGKEIQEAGIGKWKAENKGQKWIKLGEVFLYKGKHTFSLFNDRDLVEELIIMSHTEFEEHSTKVLGLIDKSKFELAYLFWRDKDKERLLTRSFENPRKSSYTFKAYVIPSATKREDILAKLAVEDIPIIEIDEKVYEFEKGSLRARFNSEGFWYELGNLKLAKGKHQVKAIESDMFSVDIVEIATRRQQRIAASKQRLAAKIHFKKINPTRYKIQVEAQTPFWLVFSESYHPEWKAYIGDMGWFEAFFRKPISDEKHLLANGYANAWYIDKIGKYKITLYFWPQSLFYVGAIVSVTTFVACVTYLIYDRKRKKHQSN